MLEPSPAITPNQSPALLRVDGVSRDAYSGTLEWSIELTGGAARAIARRGGIASGHPSAGVAARLLDELRPLILRMRAARPKFVLCTIDRVDVGQSRLRLAGTCAPLISIAADVLAPPV